MKTLLSSWLATFCLMATVMPLPSSHHLESRANNSPGDCIVNDQEPAGVYGWARYNHDIMSGLVKHTNSEGIKKDFTHVNQKRQTDGRGPIREFDATFRADGWFYLDEDWVNASPTSPVLSETFYVVHFTDQNPVETLSFHFLERDGYTGKYCQFYIGGNDGQRTFTINQYVKPYPY